MKYAALFAALLIAGAQSPVMAQAQVACQNSTGTVYLRNGRCNFGEQMVQVMDSPQNTNQNRSRYGTPVTDPNRGQGYVACRDSMGTINRRRGQCAYGETFIKVIN